MGKVTREELLSLIGGGDLNRRDLSGIYRGR
jgi:hypothetical protein